MKLSPDATKLLGHLHRGGNYGYFWTDYKNQSAWFKCGTVTDLPGWAPGHNTYFVVNPQLSIPATNGRGEQRPPEQVAGRNELVHVINALYAELDAKDEVDECEYYSHLPANFADLATIDQKKAIKAAQEAVFYADPKTYLARAFARVDRGVLFPSALVHSGGGYHAYYWLDQPVLVDDTNRERIALLQREWVHLVGGDAGAVDLKRVLRVPGTLNHKPGFGTNPPPVHVVYCNESTVYTLLQFEHLTGIDEAYFAGLKHPTVKREQPNTNDDVIGEYNRTHAIVDLLTGHGYTLAWNNANMARLARPGRDKEQSSVIVFRDAGKETSYHHSSNDALHNGHKHDAFSAFQTLVHNGDFAAAFEAAKREQGNWKDAPQDQPNQTTSVNVFELLSTVEQTPAALKRFALDHAHDLAALDKAKLSAFCNELHDKKVSAEWLRTELRPAVNDLKRQNRDNERKTWRDYVEAAEEMGYTFRLNDLADTVEVNGQRMSDVIEAELLSRLHEKGLGSADIARRAFITAAAQNRYHPIKEYLNSTKWDGNDHIAALASHFTDAHDPIIYADGTQRTVFHAWLLRWLIGAVAKVYNPKDAQNAMLVLDGAQDIGKSYFVRWLCPIEALHFEGAIKTEDKDYIGYMTQYFVWEVGELGATIRKADHEALKAMITLQHAVYRPSYGRHALDKPALASLIGTVNFEGGLLNDSTGHRRFRPVTLLALDKEYSQLDVNQVWAQAMTLYRNGDPWRLTSEEKARHAEITAQYEVEDVMESQIRQWFTIEPGNPEMFTHTSTIIEKLRTFAGIRGNDKAIQMQCASTLHKLALAKTKRDNRWGYVGITFNEQT